MTKYNSNGQIEHFCDNPKHHKSKKAHGAMSLRFWEGSKHRFTGEAVQVCDECAEEFITQFKNKFKKHLREIPEI